MLKPLTSLLADFTHLFYPQTCLGCGTDILSKGNLLCTACLMKLPSTAFLNEADNPVEKIFYGRIKVNAAGSAFYFTKDSLLQHLIIQLKYRSNKEVGYFLGNLLGYQLSQTARFNDVEAIIPLPLNPRKERKRGYNQAAVIADGIATVWQKPVLKNAIQRLVFTETQTHKDRVSRWQTMEDVFAVKDPALLQNKHILLVDDIVTTGATLEACGEKILTVNKTALSIVTIAYTI